MPFLLYYIFISEFYNCCLFAGDQVGSCDEEGSGTSDSFHGEGEGGDDGIIRLN